jgi:hypothetical protein
MAKSTKGRPRKVIQTESFQDKQRGTKRTRKYTTIKSVVNGKVRYLKIQPRMADDTLATGRDSELAMRVNFQAASD